MKFSQIKNYPCFQCGRIMTRNIKNNYYFADNVLPKREIYAFGCNCLKINKHLQCEVFLDILTGDVVGQNFLVDNLLILSHRAASKYLTDAFKIMLLPVNPLEEYEGRAFPPTRTCLLHLPKFIRFDFHNPESVRNKVKLLLTFQ